MSEQIGFIGDIHGEVHLLDRLLEKAIPKVSRLIFLGDYVNRGRASRQVIDRLVHLQAEEVPATFLAGNHDRAFLLALNGADIVPFLRIGGAATIASYIDEPIDNNVAAQLRRSVPEEHRAFLAGLQWADMGPDYVAAHQLASDMRLDKRYGIFGHVPQRSLTPSIDDERALIDTGCGTLPDGRLTCFLWPDRAWFQVSEDSNSAV